MSLPLRTLCYLLLDAAAAPGAAEALAGIVDPAVREALEFAIEEPVSEAAAITSARALASYCGDALAADALLRGLASPSGPLRLAVVRTLPRVVSPTPAAPLALVLARDPSPSVRRAAVPVLARDKNLLLLGIALSDPVWRVRAAAIRFLAMSGNGDPSHRQLLRRAWGRPLDPLVAGAFEFLERAWTLGAAELELETKTTRASATSPEVASAPVADWWSDDPSVLHENLKHLPDRTVERELPLLVRLLDLHDGYPLNDCVHDIHAFVVRALGRRGNLELRLRAVAYALDPRHPFASRHVASLVEGLDANAREELVATALDADVAPLVRWALRELCSDRALTTSRARSEAHVMRLAELARSRSIAVRADAIDALGALSDRGTPGARAEAARGLEDDAEAVRIATLRALYARSDASASDPTRAPLASIEGVLELSGSAAFRATVLDCVAASASPLPEVFWQRAASDGDADVRVATARALVAHAERDPRLYAHLAKLDRDASWRVRRAAIHPARAEQLVGAPNDETSFAVLMAAARLVGKPLSAIAPVPLDAHRAPARLRTAAYWGSPVPVGAAIADAAQDGFSVPEAADRATETRALGATGVLVSPLIVSGRFGLGEAGFWRAIEAGITTLFWEPEYDAETSFARRLPAARREALTWVAGTFAAAPSAIERDLDRSRSLLGLDRIDVFILFWARDERRLGDDVLERMLDLRHANKIRTFGFSTHNRPLAARAIDQGWPVAMVRHSAAHPSAEEELFPHATARKCGVLTFSATAQTRLIVARDGRRAPTGSTPSAADCYRYSLSQTGVAAVVTAPRTVRELEENLAVLERPWLDPEAQAAMRAYGAPLRETSRRLRELIVARRPAEPEGPWNA
jgi:aryl-alcohol dehydrogenase-like predicted oxidoreductase